MRIALISDVHANLSALQAVADDVSRQAVERVCCLGDTVGYGWAPRECLALMRELAGVVLAGNHDVDVTRDGPLPGTNPLAATLQAWTRAQLSAGELELLGQLPWRYVEPGLMVAVHGSYLNPDGLLGYVTSTMLEENLRAVLRAALPPLAVCGHTHVPICGWLEGGRLVEPPASGRVHWPASAEVVLLNPGSVGQPRDGDPRASWGIVNTMARTFELRRVAYDVASAVRALNAAGLPASLGERLRIGR